MKIKLLLIATLIFLINYDAFSQSLNSERIRHIKECTVKVTVEGKISTGTGFFVNPDGTLLTCWHVIEPAIIRDPNDNHIIGAKKIFVTLNTNETLQFDIPVVLLKAYNSAIAYDYCILVPMAKHSSFPFLKLGDFNKVSEGDEVYTCGYPLGIDQQFITHGIVSTKYVDSSISIITPQKTSTKMPRNQALLDLTLNKGNSGGAVILVGDTPADDCVIGISDFIINPIGGNAEALVTLLKNSSGGVFIGGIDTNALFANIIEVLNNTSIGVSGCVSINHAIDGFVLITH